MKLHDLIDHLIAIELDGGGDRVVGYLDYKYGFCEIEEAVEIQLAQDYKHYKSGQELIYLC